VPAIEVSDDPGEGGRGEGDAVGQQARNCPGRAFSSGAVEEQSAEGAASARPWKEALHCIQTKQVAASRNATRTPAERDNRTRLRVSWASQRAVPVVRAASVRLLFSSASLEQHLNSE